MCNFSTCPINYFRILQRSWNRQWWEDVVTKTDYICLGYLYPSLWMAQSCYFCLSNVQPRPKNDGFKRPYVGIISFIDTVLCLAYVSYLQEYFYPKSADGNLISFYLLFTEWVILLCVLHSYSNKDEKYDLILVFLLIFAGVFFFS